MLHAFVRNPRLQVLIITLLLVAGLAALATLPRTEDPRVTNRVATVLTPWPGADAERLEALVTEPIEDSLRELPEIKILESKSLPGLSVVRVELKDSVYATDPVWSRARDKVADARPGLPAGVLPSRFDDDRGYAYTRILALGWNWAGDVGEPELAALKRYAEALQTRLRAVPGTDLVELFGAPEEEIRVTLDPQRSVALRLAPEQVAAALGTADAKVAAGVLRGGASQMQVEVSGELGSLERVRQAPLRVDRDGLAVRLGEVAEVERGIRAPLDRLALVHGRPAVVVAARMLPDLSIGDWSDRVDAALAEFQTGLPGNVTVATLFDQRGYTQRRLGELAFNILLGFGLILVVLLVSLGWRAALVTASALPLTVLFTLSCMALYGLPIHQMSVTGLVVALGIMVDNAIVMTDLIQRRRQAGVSALAAAREAVGHLWLPLAGSTLTTILAFAPIVLMPGPAGEFVGGIALSVIFALIGSYLLSHTLIAGLGARLLPAGDGDRRRWYRDGLCLPWLGRAYATSLEFALRRPLLATLFIALTPAAGFIAAGQLTEQFFPPSDRDMFHIELRLPPHASLDATRATVEAVAARLDREPDILAHHWFVGGSAPSFYYNLLQDQDGAPYYAQAMVTARDYRAANRLIPELQRHLDDLFPQAQILVRKLEQGPPFKAPVELRLYGPDLDRLRALGEEARGVLAIVADVIHTRATLATGVPKVVLATRDELAQRAGLSPVALAAQLQAALDGAVGGSVLEGVEELPVRVRIAGEQRQGPGDLASLAVTAPQADVALGAPTLAITSLGALEIRPTSGSIPRRDGQRVTVVEGYLRAGVLPGAVLARFRAALSEHEFAMPAGYRMEFGGESAKRDDAVGNLLSSVGVIVTLLVLVVVLSFNSFRLAAIIFVVAVQAAGLGLLSVYGFGYPFGFTVIVGLLGLSGLAINAAIVILAELKANPLAAAGDGAGHFVVPVLRADSLQSTSPAPGLRADPGGGTERRPALKKTAVGV